MAAEFPGNHQTYVTERASSMLLGQKEYGDNRLNDARGQNLV